MFSIVVYSVQIKTEYKTYPFVHIYQQLIPKRLKHTIRFHFFLHSYNKSSTGTYKFASANLFISCANHDHHTFNQLHAEFDTE